MIWYCLKESVKVICLTILAVNFNKWWIILFYLIMCSSYSSSSNNEVQDVKEEI